MQPRLLSEPLRLAGGPLLRLQSDERLVRLVRAGSHPAFAEIVHRYRSGLVRYTDGLVGSARGEDVVQQGLAGAHTALMTDERPVTLKPWLFRIVHNGALNVLRADRDIEALDDHADELVGLSVEAEAASRERFRDTVRAVQALPTPQRDALLLRELEGRSHMEIAAALGVSAGAARQHLMRARVTMRAAVSAVTPFPLVLQLAAAGGAAGTGVPIAGAGAGFGLGKLGASVLAAGAIAGGASVAVPAVLPDAGPGQAGRAEQRSGAPVATGGSADRTPAAGARLAVVVAPGSAADRGPASSGDRDEGPRTSTVGRAGDPDDREDDAERDGNSRHGTGSQEQTDDERSARSAPEGSDGDGVSTSDAGAHGAGADADATDAPDVEPSSSGADTEDRGSVEPVRESAPTALALPIGSNLEYARSADAPDDGARVADDGDDAPAAP